MCAIIGYVKGSKKLETDTLRGMMRRMFLAAQSRGRDATGYGFVKDKNLYIKKAPGLAKDFVKYLEEVPFADVPIFIGHTRAATKGDPKDTENNHPIYSKDSGMAIVHNGQIWTKKDLKTDGKCDSELILRLIELRVEPYAGMKFADENFHGGAAYALIGVDFPNTLYLFRRTNPITVAYIPKLDLFLFASTKAIIEAGLTKNREFLGYFRKTVHMYSAVYREVEDDSILVVNRNNGELVVIDEILPTKVTEIRGYCGTITYKDGKKRKGQEREDEEGEEKLWMS